MVGHRELPHFEILVEGNEVAGVRLNAVRGRADGGIAHAVTAGVVLDGVARGLPRRRPEPARFFVAQIDVASAEIEGRIVVAIAGEAAEAGISIERVAAGGVGDDAKVRLAAKVVHPRQGRIRLRNHVFAVLVVEIAKLHNASFLQDVPPDCAAPGQQWSIERLSRSWPDFLFQKPVKRFSRLFCYLGRRKVIILDAARTRNSQRMESDSP